MLLFIKSVAFLFYLATFPYFSINHYFALINISITITKTFAWAKFFFSVTYVFRCHQFIVGITSIPYFALTSKHTFSSV